MTDKPLLLTSSEICRRARISYRQLDNWVWNGYITPHIEADGSGTRRWWLEWQVGELAYLRLTMAGTEYGKQRRPVYQRGS